MSESRISSTVDFEKNGRQTGFLRLPHSVHESAYGWIPIPVVCLKNGNGPTILLNSGNHGDEYEGQVTLMKLIRELKPEQVPLLAAARQAGTLSLALRSIADVNQVEIAADDRSRQRGNINVVRYGVTSSTAFQK